MKSWRRVFVLIGLVGLISSGWAAINPQFPQEQQASATDTRYSILVIEKASRKTATEEAIYVSSFMNLPVYIIEVDSSFSVFSGMFMNQMDALHYVKLLKQSGFRKASIRRKLWEPKQEAARFNAQYLTRYDTQKKTSTSQLREDATKVIGKHPDVQPDLWVSVKDNPELEKKLRRGWLLLSQKNYTDACSHFQTLRNDSYIRMKATFGLASCFHKSAQPAKAVPLYLELLINEQGVEHILHPLIEDLTALGRDQEANAHRHRYDALTKNYWKENQYQQSFQEQVQYAIKQNDSPKVLALLESHESLVAECSSINTFYSGANHLKRHGHTNTAKHYYQQMMEHCPDKWHLRLGLIYSLLDLSPLSESQQRIDQEASLSHAPTHYKNRLNSLRFDLDLKAAYQHPEFSEAAYQSFSMLNKKYPRNYRILNQLGWWHFKHDEFNEALGFFQQSQRATPNEDAQKGELFALLELNQKEKALAIAGKENFQQIEADLLKEQLQSLPIDDPEVLTLTDRILALEPDYLPAKTTRAWHLYEVKAYQQSHDAFLALRQTDPANMSYLKGYVYSLIGLGDMEQTETVLVSETPQDADMDQIASGLYMDKAVHFYEHEQYTDSLEYVNRYLELNPNHQGALALRSWVHYHSNERAKAIADLEQVWQEAPTTENTKSLVFLYKSMYQHDPSDTKYKDFLTQLKDSDNPEWHTLAAKEYAIAKQPISAAQITEAQDQEYSNANAINAHLAVEYRKKSGDEGTSQLESIGVFLGADIYSKLGKQWRLQLGWESLNAGKLPDSPFIGRAFLAGNPGQPIQEDETHLDAKRLWLQHWSETGLLKYAAIGTTALDSIIHVQPVFELEGSFETDLLNKRTGPFWNIHQRLVDESVLSYIGQHDPYSKDEWGRVLQSGLTLGNQWQLTAPYWFNADISGDYYWGKNIWENWSIKASSAIGRTDMFENYQQSLGIYTNLAHYDKNSNFYTFGHGGYYSPQVLAGVGPFTSWEAYQDNTRFWWKAEASVGVFWESLDSAPLYPKDPDVPGQYEADSGLGIGSRLKLQYRKLWTNYFETSGFIEWRQVPNFNDGRIQATFRLYFEPRNALTTYDVFDRLELP